MIRAIARNFAGNRIRWSRAILAATLFVAFFSEPPHYPDPWVGDILELSGFAMLVGATLWRIWCLAFIGGTKDGKLAVLGPYSVSRNPLYVGNFLGIVGFGLAVGLPLLAVGLAVLFGILYPAVVEQEERRLKEIFGDVYEAYCRKVPRWIPRWSLYSEPETVVVSTKRMRQAILDGMWYPWAFALAEVIEVLRDHGALRYLF